MKTTDQLLESLHQELMYAHLLHETFFALYAAGEDVARLLEDTDEQFFNVANNAFLDAITLSFTRLLDGDQSAGQDNLSLAYLLKRTPLRKHALFASWETDLKGIRTKAGKFFLRRNKMVGHLDFETTTSRKNPSQFVLKKRKLRTCTRQLVHGSMEFVRHMVCYPAITRQA